MATHMGIFHVLMGSACGLRWCVYSCVCGQMLHQVCHWLFTLQGMKYYQIGQLMAMAVVQGGSGFQFLAPCIFQYFCGVEVSAILVDPQDVADSNVRTLLEKVRMSISLLSINHGISLCALICLCKCTSSCIIHQHIIA